MKEKKTHNKILHKDYILKAEQEATTPPPLPAPLPRVQFLYVYIFSSV